MEILLKHMGWTETPEVDLEHLRRISKTCVGLGRHDVSRGYMGWPGNTWGGPGDT